jgi:hypothetical protein
MDMKRPLLLLMVCRGSPDIFHGFFLFHYSQVHDDREREAQSRAYMVTSKLTDYLFEKGHIDNDEKETIRRRITICRSVNGEKIVNALHQLHEEGYWRSL